MDVDFFKNTFKNKPKGSGFKKLQRFKGQKFKKKLFFLNLKDFESYF